VPGEGAGVHLGVGAGGVVEVSARASPYDFPWDSLGRGGSSSGSIRVRCERAQARGREAGAKLEQEQ
jgi:hypothetical protein